MSTVMILQPSGPYWTSDDLARLGFNWSAVTARTLNLAYSDPRRRGPFCRLDVEVHLGATPGVYGWVVDRRVEYIGKSKDLRQIVHGVRMSRANNDYTYMAPSKVLQTSSPRVFVNGRLNEAISSGSKVTWWWLPVLTELEAIQTEARLLGTLPRWNKQELGPDPSPHTAGMFLARPSVDARRGALWPPPTDYSLQQSRTLPSERAGDGGSAPSW